MKKLFFFIVMLVVAKLCNSQASEMITIKKDSSGFLLTAKGASHLASLPLKCILQQFPNKTNHTSNTDSDHVLLPQAIHPSFYGCFDWHSSVHGHWMLVKLLKEFPALPESQKIRDVLNNTLSAENVLKEAKYFDMPNTSSWERTYGWAWLLKLDAELFTWNDADAKKWQQALQPLTKKVVLLWKKFLPKQTYANRTGVHPNTAFGLCLALDYARAENDLEFEKAIVISSKKLFINDKQVPAKWEPNGSDFLSPAMEEADLMRRILPKQKFIKWFNQFVSLSGLQHLTKLPVVSDRGDLQIVHLDGLCFSRSWCMKNLAALLPVTDARKKLLNRSSLEHLKNALPHVVSGEYGGEHWLASFVLYALLN